MNSLPKEIFALICSFLDQKSKVKISETCKLARDITADLWQELSIDSKAMVYKCKHLLRNAKIVNIHCELSEAECQFISLYTRKLTTLTINSKLFEANFLEPLLRTCFYLKNLYINVRMNSLNAEFFSKCINIEYITIKSSNIITDKEIKHLLSVIELKINSPAILTFNTILTLKKLKKLRLIIEETDNNIYLSPKSRARFSQINKTELVENKLEQLKTVGINVEMISIAAIISNTHSQSSGIS